MSCIPEEERGEKKTESPWQVDRCAFDSPSQRLEIHVAFNKGGRFPCPQCGQSGCPAYDSQERTWRHLN